MKIEMQFETGKLKLLKWLIALKENVMFVRLALLLIVFLSVVSATPIYASVDAKVQQVFTSVENKNFKLYFDTAYEFQKQVEIIKQKNPEVLWPKLIKEYYENVYKHQFSELSEVDKIYQRAFNAGYAISSFKELQNLLAGKHSKKILESRTRPWSEDFTYSLGEKRQGTVVYVSVSYNEIDSSPILENKRLKTLIIEFIFDYDTGFFVRCMRVENGDEFWSTEDIERLVSEFVRQGNFDSAIKYLKFINFRELSEAEKTTINRKIEILTSINNKNLTYHDFDLDEVIAREKEERAKPNIPNSDFDKTAWIEITKGEEKADFHFREDDSLYYEDELLTSKLSGEEVDDPTIYKFKAEKLIISKPSPSKRYTFIKVCENDNFFDQLYLLDAKSKTLKPTFAGKYGPREAIYWGPDERYATFKYYDEGYLFHYHVDLVTALSFWREVMTLEDLEKVMDEYSRIVLDNIRKNWNSPRLKNEKQEVAAALVDITIKEDGKISNIWFKQQSNIQAINDAAWKAIKTSNPLPALPREYTGEYDSSSEQLTLYFTNELVSLLTSTNIRDYPALLRVLVDTPLYDSIVKKEEHYLPAELLIQKGYPSGNVVTTLKKGDVLTLVRAYPNDDEAKYAVKVKNHNDQEGYCLSKFVEILETNGEKGDILAIHLSAPYDFEGDVAVVDEWIKKYQDFVRKYPEGQYVPEAMLSEASLDLYCLQFNENILQKKDRFNRIAEIMHKLKIFIKKDFSRDNYYNRFFAEFLNPKTIDSKNINLYGKNIKLYGYDRVKRKLKDLFRNVDSSISFLDEVKHVK